MTEQVVPRAADVLLADGRIALIRSKVGGDHRNWSACTTRWARTACGCGSSPRTANRHTGTWNVWCRKPGPRWRPSSPRRRPAP
jgi:hypothetical protein